MIDRNARSQEQPARAVTDAEHARRVVLDGRAPLGVEAIRKQHPHTRPEHTKKSPAPAVHAASKAVLQQMKAAYRLFVEAYCEAAARLRAGDLTVEFPPGCLPPARPFVPADAGLPCSRAGPAAEALIDGRPMSGM